MAKLLALTQNSIKMPNWCWNDVTFNGPKENLQQLSKILEDMVKRCNETGMGVLPIIQEATEDGYFFGISVEDENANEESEVDNPFIQIRYDTRWSPNPENLKWLAVKFDVDFVQDYEESGNKMYGQYRLKHEHCDDEGFILETRYLTDEEHDSCMYITSPDDEKTFSKDEVTEEEWERLIDDEDWSENNDYEKLSDTLDDKEWENVN